MSAGCSPASRRAPATASSTSSRELRSRCLPNRVIAAPATKTSGMVHWPHRSGGADRATPLWIRKLRTVLPAGRPPLSASNSSMSAITSRRRLRRIRGPSGVGRKSHATSSSGCLPHAAQKRASTSSLARVSPSLCWTFQCASYARSHRPTVSWPAIASLTADSSRGRREHGLRALALRSFRQTEHPRKGPQLVLPPGIGRLGHDHAVLGELLDHLVVALVGLAVAAVVVDLLEAVGARPLAARLDVLRRVAHELDPDRDQVLGDAEDARGVGGVERGQLGAQALVDRGQEGLVDCEARL